MSAHAFEHEGMAYTPDGPLPAGSDVAAHNAALTTAELAEWAKVPDYFAPAYCDPMQARHHMHYGWKGGFDGTLFDVTTWSGAPLGRAKVTAAWRGRFGARLVQIRVWGNNGAHYTGRMSADWNLVRLRRIAGT